MSFFEELKRRNVIRIGAAYLAFSWLTIQVVETVFPAFGFGDSAVRLVVILLTIGFLPALVLAWVFELTPEGLRRESTLDRSAPGRAETGAKLDRLIVLALALALGYFAFDKFVLDPRRDAAEIAAAADRARSEALVESYSDNSIAVLPFADLSPEGDQAYFSDGIAEELLNLLARIPELRVISRSSAFSFKDQKLEIPEIAERLNVAHVLEGSVRKAGDRIRITAQLIDARSDTQLWSETYDRSLEDVFAIQDEIAAHVVSRLKFTLLGEAPLLDETDSEAYTLYLQARYLLSQLSSDAAAKAADLLRRVLEIDPHYVPALNQLAQLYVFGATTGSVPIDESRERVRALVIRALAVDPDNGHAVILSGWPDGGAIGNMAVVIQTLQRGLALDPSNLDAVRVAAGVSELLGRLDQAIALNDYVLARDPLCTDCIYRQAKTYLAAGRLDDAEAAIRQFRILNPGGRHTLGIILLLQGDAQAALAEFDQLSEPQNPHRVKLHGRALALYSLGREDQFEQAFRELRERYGASDPALVAEVCAWTSQADLAFKYLDMAHELGPFELKGMFLNPLYANLHTDPRWPEFRRKTGTAPEQLTVLDFEVSLP